MLASSLASLLLFYTAPALSTSVVFRLSCGSALFTAGSLLVLAYFISKCVAGRRARNRNMLARQCTRAHTHARTRVPRAGSCPTSAA